MPDSLLKHLGASDAVLLGSGGEARVFELDEAKVLRVHSAGVARADAERRHKQMVEVSAATSALSFDTPEVLEVGEHGGIVYSIERRIPGMSVAQALAEIDGDDRDALVTSYLDASWELGEARLGHPHFGEVFHSHAIQTESFVAFLTERAERSASGSAFEAQDWNRLANALGEPEDGRRLVHLDYFAGNVMTNGDSITGVIDFGYSTVVGDRRLTAVAAAAHLLSARITPTVTDDDRETVRRWLTMHHLDAYFDVGERWMAAYWLFVRHDDPAAFAWSQSILGRND